MGHKQRNSAKSLGLHYHRLVRILALSIRDSSAETETFNRVAAGLSFVDAEQTGDDLALSEGAITSGQIMTFEQQLRQVWPRYDFVVLQTCHRIEVYVGYPLNDHEFVDHLTELLAERVGLDTEPLRASVVVREQAEAVRHLMRVTAGLDAAIVGETEVLGQVKRAYEEAVEQQQIHTGGVLHTAFQDALTQARKLQRDKSNIDSATQAKSDTIKDGWGQRVCGILKERGALATDTGTDVDALNPSSSRRLKITLLGAGQLAESVLVALMGLKDFASPLAITVLNRDVAKAQRLVDRVRSGKQNQHELAAKPLDALNRRLKLDDVILSTVAGTTILEASSDHQETIERRCSRPLLLIDLGQPATIDSQLKVLSNVELIDFEAICERDQEQVSPWQTHAEQVITLAASRCMTTIQTRDVGQLIRQLRHRLHDIGDLEHERTLSKLLHVFAEEGTPHTSLSSDQRDAVEAILNEHTRRMINKVLHLPLSQINKEADTTPRGFYAGALRRLFDLQLEEPVDTIEPADDDQSTSSAADSVHSNDLSA